MKISFDEHCSLFGDSRKINFLKLSQYKKFSDGTMAVNCHHHVVNSIGQGASPPVGQINLDTHARGNIFECFTLHLTERNGKDFHSYICVT